MQQVRTPGALRDLVDRLEAAGVASPRFGEAREYLRRCAGFVEDFRARTLELRAALVEDLATGAVTAEQAGERAAALVARHGVENPGAVSMHHADSFQLASQRCTVLAWQAVQAAGAELDKDTRASLAGIDAQIGKLELRLPEDMRGSSVSSSAGRDQIGTWSDLVDARRRRDDVVALRLLLRAYDLVPATADEAAQEAEAEWLLLARATGQINYVMRNPQAADALGRTQLAPGFDTIVSTGRPA